MQDKIRNANCRKSPQIFLLTVIVQYNARVYHKFISATYFMALVSLNKGKNHKTSGLCYIRTGNFKHIFLEIVFILIFAN